jgi:pheromone shutdown protein TraB
MQKIKWTEGVKTFLCGYDISRITGKRRDPGLDVKKAVEFINREGIHFSIIDGMIDNFKKKLKKLHLLEEMHSILTSDLNGIEFTGFYNYASSDTLVCYNLLIDFIIEQRSIYEQGSIYITSLRKTPREKGNSGRWNYSTQLKLKTHHIEKAKENHLKLIEEYQRE